MNISFKVKSLDLKIKGEGKVTIEDMEMSVTDVNLADIPAIIREVQSVIAPQAAPQEKDNGAEFFVHKMTMNPQSISQLFEQNNKPCDDPDCFYCEANK